MSISNRIMLALAIGSLLLSACAPINPARNSVATHIGRGAESEAASIAYLRYTEGFWQIWLTEPSGERHQQLTFDAMDKVRLSWSPKQQQLLTTRSDGSIVRVNLAGNSEVLNLPFESVLDAQWSPDGEWLVLSVNSTQTSDNNDLWLVRSNGQDVKKLTHNTGVTQLASWNNDSSRLVFSTGSGKSAYQIWTMDLKTDHREQLTVGEGFRFDPVFTPDERVVFTENTGTGFDLWLKEKGKSARRLTHDPAHDAQPAVSPNGSRLLFYSQRDNAKRIWLLSLEQVDAPVAITPADVYSRQPVWIEVE